MKMLRIILLSLLFPLLATGCRSEYREGFNQAVDDVRKVRREGGVVGEAGMVIGNELGLPGDESKSEEWNRGYQAGARSELRK